jgi:hypothetical protein
MQATPDSVRRAAESASPAWIVMPRYEAGAPAALTPLSKARAFMEMVNGGFNYSVHGRKGFEALARVVDRCECHTFTYGDLEEAATLFDGLATTS